MVIAAQLAYAVLEGESPKEFFRRQSAKRPPGPPPGWEEHWDGLDDWAKVAATEFIAEECAVELAEEGHKRLDVRAGYHEWMIFENEEAARIYALLKVEEDIDNQPEVFNTTFIDRFINVDRLRNYLRSDEENSIREAYEHDWPDYESMRDGLIKHDQLEQEDFFTEDGEPLPISSELENAIDTAYDNYIDKMVDERLEDPIAFLREIYGNDATKQAREMVGIDSTAAAEAAIREDGWRHYLARYDGNSYDLPSGAIYVRTS